jgi:DNA-directed RNA polymerase specialized sigma24 family protein
MVELKLTDERLDELQQEASGNSCERARNKCWVVYLKGNGYAHREIAKVVRVDEDTVTEYLRKSRDGGAGAAGRALPQESGAVGCPRGKAEE